MLLRKSGEMLRGEGGGGVTLQWISIPFRESGNTPSCFMLIWKSGQASAG